MVWALLLLCLLYGCGSTSADRLQKAEARPLNLLFILTDNQPASILGSYGNPDVRTPNIDQLAREGMLFSNAFAVNGMCSPTRATLMTGLMPSQHGVHNWLDDEKLHEWPEDWSVVGEYRTLPQTLASRGYQTALIGKWHLGQPWKSALGYDHWVTFTDGHTLDFWQNTVIDNQSTYEVTDRHIVDFFADKAVEYLQSLDAGRPFYLQLNFDGPYLNPPTNVGPARNRHYDSYLGGEFSSFPRVAINSNIIAQLRDENTTAWTRRNLIAAIRRHNDPESMANVASQNTVVDDAVGVVMQALREAGLDENTLVVFSSDQGNFYGQHGLWQHTIVTTPSNLYEAALNIPLIFRHPGSIKPGGRVEALIGQYHIPATLLDYLGFRDVTFEGSPGVSFAGMLKGEQVAWSDEAYYEQEETRGIRTTGFAYWQRISGIGEPELYDMRHDPGQHRNLAGDPKYAGVQEELKGRLARYFSTYTTPRYDLWHGGTAKGSVARPAMFKRLYGDQWETIAESLPAFSEP